MTAAPRGALLDIGMTMLIPAYQLVAVVNTLAAAAAAGLSGRPFTFAAGAFCISGAGGRRPSPGPGRSSSPGAAAPRQIRFSFSMSLK